MGFWRKKRWIGEKLPAAVKLLSQGTLGGGSSVVIWPVIIGPQGTPVMPTIPNAILSRHARAIRILTCLQSGPGFNAYELARHLGVSRRTIYRDLNLIREAGVLIRFDTRQAAYRLERDSQQHLLPSFESVDLCNLVLASHTSLMNRSPQMHCETRQAASKLLCLYPHEIRNRMTRMMSACFVQLPPLSFSDEDWDTAKMILQAIGDQVCIRAEVNDEHGVHGTKIAPYRLDVEIDKLTLTGRSSFDASKKSFPVSSLDKVEITNDIFQPPRAARLLDREGELSDWLAPSGEDRSQAFDDQLQANGRMAMDCLS